MARTTLPLPEGVDATVDGLDLRVEGPNGAVERRLWYPNIDVTIEDDAVVIEASSDERATRATAGTFESHVENMFYGVTEGWEYRMRTVYSHFPMQVSVRGEEIVVENFLGERAPRRTPIYGDTEVSVEGEEVVLTGPDKEAVGQTAAGLEQLTRVRDKDIRVFQDGAYITAKPRGGLKYE